MPDRPNPQEVRAVSARARCAAGFVNSLRELVDATALRPAVRRFLYHDLPALPDLLARLYVAASSRIQPTPDPDPHEMVGMRQRLMQLVDRIRWANRAGDTIPGLWEAFEADVAAILRGLTHRQALLMLDTAARELAELRWNGQGWAATGDGNTGWAPDIILGNWPEEDQ